MVSLTTDELIDKMRNLRGPSDVWLRREIALSKWMAISDGKGAHERIFGRGDWRGTWDGVEVHTPALLIFNELTETVSCVAACDDDDTICYRPVRGFHSNTQHVGVAREIWNEEGEPQNQTY